MTGFYHTDPGILHIGCEKPRAYFIPFAAADDCSKRENSSYFTLLNGEWDFKFFDNVYELDLSDDKLPGDIEFTDKMTVPFCWQLKLGRGYDVPNYINQDYPYPVDPPHLPDIDPCGLYRRTFTVNKKADKRYYINLEGVASCFYLWINSVFAGYSEVSHCTSELDITDKLTDGENTAEILVVKHCTGSYLEDQDFFRLSGIFRDVYILERDRIHIEDVQLYHTLSDDFSSAEVKIDIKLNGNAECRYDFFAPSGERLISGKTDSKAEFTVPNPALWNPEQPILYTLKISCGNENLYFKLGLRRFEIKNSTVLLNGVKFKCHGINRHDSDPETGYAVSVESMRRDLKILKGANVNMIRTSHYPNDPRFIEMCDEQGFAVVDEADIETHGMGYNYGDWYWDYWAFLSDTPEWREAYLDRAQRLFERDKNHSCVVLWSLGNESGCGENHRAMAQYIRSRDDRALIHYENAHLEYAARLNKDFSDISDVESRMYAPISYLNSYLENDEYKKPFFYCEYVCSMSTGDVYMHFDNVEDNDKYFGGCIWELTDHAVNIGSKDNPVYRYGGDFGDSPNDNYSCVDGLVFPDRTPRPGYYDMKKVHKPFYARLDGDKLIIKNRRFFTTLEDCVIEYELEHNGVVISSCKIDDTAVAPQSERSYDINIPDIKDGLLTLNVYLKLKDKAGFADAGYTLGDEQIIISDTAAVEESAPCAEVKAAEDRTSITVSAAGITYRISKITGLIDDIADSTGSLITKPVDFNIWRCHNYNSRGFDGVWSRARFDRAIHHAYSVELTQNTAEKAVVAVKMSFCAAAMPPAVIANIEYVFTSLGADISCSCKVGERVPNLPRFGLNITMDRTFDSVSYLGYGPHESYSDRYRACRLSRFATTVDDNFVPYIKPQEFGAHYKTRCAEVTDSHGRGLKITDIGSDGFSFNAKRYTDKMLHDTKHVDELEDSGSVTVSADYKIDASSGCDEGREPERRFTEKEFTFRYRLTPVK